MRVLPFLAPMARALLMCCFGRLRASDSTRIRNASVVGGFLEGSLSRSKASQRKERAASFIPLVVPTFGLYGAWDSWRLVMRFAWTMSQSLVLVTRTWPPYGSLHCDTTLPLIQKRCLTGFEKSFPSSSMMLSFLTSAAAR